MIFSWATIDIIQWLRQQFCINHSFYDLTHEAWHVWRQMVMVIFGYTVEASPLKSNYKDVQKFKSKISILIKRLFLK